MRIASVILAFIASVTVIHAAAPKWTWAASAGGPGSDEARHVAVGQSGTVYLMGSISDSARFGDMEIAGRGSLDLFVASRGSGGWNWVRRIGSPEPDIDGGGVAVGADGAVYFAGTLESDSIYLQTGTSDSLIVATGKNNVVIGKYAADGHLLWVRVMAVGEGGKASGTALDRAGMFYVTGGYAGSIALGELSASSAGAHDVFVAAVAADGTPARLIHAGGLGEDAASGIAVDGAGNIYVTGSVAGNAQFGTKQVTGANGNTFIARYGQDAEPVWVLGDGGAQFVPRIAADAAGNCYLAGAFFGSCTFGGTTFTSAGETDGYVLKYNADGVYQWSKQIAGPVIDSPTDIAADSAGNAYVTGYAQGLPNNGQVFVSKYTTTGTRSWLVTDTQTGVLHSLDGGGIAVGGDAAVYICGGYTGVAGFGSTTFTSVGSSPTSSSGTDLYVARLGGVAGVENPGVAGHRGLVLSARPAGPGAISIAYRIPGGAHADVALYDIRGARIATLLHGISGQGEWAGPPAVAIPNGTYFIVLQSESDAAMVAERVTITR